MTVQRCIRLAYFVDNLLVEILDLMVEREEVAEIVYPGSCWDWAVPRLSL